MVKLLSFLNGHFLKKCRVFQTVKDGGGIPHKGFFIPTTPELKLSSRHKKSKMFDLGCRFQGLKPCHNCSHKLASLSNMV